MGFVIDIESIQKQLVFDFDDHRTLLHASQSRRNRRSGETCPRIAFQALACLAFLGIPSTVRISRAASTLQPGKSGEQFFVGFQEIREIF